MTYAAPVFAHANPKALYQLQVLQNNFCRRASGTLDMSKSSSTQLLTIPTHYYKQPYPTSLPSTSFHPRPRNVLSDPPDELTAEVEG
ncbi:hypothetical protein EVAR_44578_1 [Eumeta japonica]|uniref:Uncharacterized protein n=1 Tax=Eumeta variegata TaxID=151549 RepID=A0A4C1XAE9_EUMVA|nr:hypothetical protein EVAR_44578_1 [Eumeta japonica]